MSQAIKQYMADEGVDNLRESSLSINSDDLNDDELATNNDKFFQKYLKAQICEEGCFADRYKTQTGEMSFAVGKSADLHLGIKGRYLLPDGMVVDTYFEPVIGSDTRPGELYVDVNGRKGPNKIGYDLWSMSVFYDGTIDEGTLTPECRKDSNKCSNGYGNTPKEIRDYRFEMCRTDSNGSYGGCFGHFMENGFKFDY